VQRDHPALVAVATWRLPGLPTPRVHVSSAEVDSLRAFARGDRLSGLLADAVQQGGVRLPSDAVEAFDDVLDDWHSALRACVVLESLAVRVAAHLDSLGARWLLTKGSAVAHLDYPDPALRTFADIDLMVHPHHWADVSRHFFNDGGDAQAVFAERYGKGRTAVIDDMEVDLHRRFAVGAFGVRPDMRACFDTHDTIELAGRPLFVPSAEVRLLHACFHAVFGGASELRAVRDVAQIVAVHPQAVRGALRLAEEWRVEPVLAAAFQAASRRLELPPGYLPRLPHRRLTLAERLTLRVFRRHGGFRPQALTTLGSLPIREMVPFARSLAALSKERR